MIKLIIISLLISTLYYCSSTSEKDYSKTEVEGRADEYSAMGDTFRNNKKYDEAFNYYQIASDMYLLKGSKEKYVLSKLKQCILLLKNDKFDEFKDIIGKIKIFNQVEKLSMNNQIDYLEARYNYQEGKLAEGNIIISRLIKNYEKENLIEQVIYYRFFYAAKNMKSTVQNKIDLYLYGLKNINELYMKGKLENIEVLTFANLTMGDIYLGKKKFKEAEAQIIETEKIYNNLELTSKRDQILRQYIKLYQGLDNKGKTQYYSERLEQFKMLMIKYK